MPAHARTARYHCVCFMLFCAVLLLLIPDLPARAATVMALSLNEGAGPSYSDTSGNGNNGTCSGATCPAGGTGAVGTAGTFDGASDYITVTGSATLKPTSTVAVSAWIKASTAPGNGGEIVSMGDSYVLRLLANGNIRFFFYNGSSWTVLDTTGLNLLDNNFHHLVGQKTSDKLEIYVDGIFRVSTPASGTISYTLGLNLNIGRHGNGDPTRYFNGTIDQVAVYNSALSPLEVATRMTLKLNETAGAVAFSDASIGNTGSCSGTTCPVSGSAGAVNTATLFDGSNDFINVTGNDSLRPASTVAASAWVKASAAPANGGEIVSMGDNYAMRVLSNGNVRFLVYAGNNTWTSVDTLGVSVLGNGFHHVVGQKTATMIEVYVDGQLRAQTATSGTIVYGLGTNLNVGRHANNDPTRYFNGTIDEVNVFSRSLTAAEIGALSSVGGEVRTDKDAIIPLDTALMPPPKGTKFTDSHFPGVQLMPVTDGISDGNDCHHEYSYVPAMNSNSTRILFTCGNTAYYRNFDPATQTLEQAKYPALNSGSAGTILWSPVNPNILVYNSGPKLYWKDLGTGLSDVERDFTGDLGGLIVWQPSRSDDNDIWAFTKADPANYTADAGHKGYIVWKRSTGQVLPGYNVDMPSPPGFDEVKIDKTGRFLWIHIKSCEPANPCNVGDVRAKVRDLQQGTTTDIIFDPSDQAPGHYDVGAGIHVGYDNSFSPPDVLYRSLAAPKQSSPLLQFPGDWGRGFHFSLNADNPGWVLMSSYEGSGQSFKNLENEIFQLATDGSLRVRRLAHHHTYNVNWNYWNEPHANISKDGKFVIWTSKWLNSTERHVYMAIIPPAP
jgi:hypothetical protein